MAVEPSIFWFSVVLAACGILPVVMSFVCMKDRPLAIRKRVAEIIALSIIVPALVFLLGVQLIESDVAVAIIGTIAGYFFGRSFGSRSDADGRNATND